MKKSKLFLLGLFLLQTVVSFAQFSNTLYFDKYNYRQHKLNPAFQPIGKFYIGFPALSDISVSVGNNRFRFNDIIQNVEIDGVKKPVLFFDKHAKSDGISNFLDQLKYNERVYAAYSIDLLDFGWRTRRNSYISIALSNRFEAMVVVPQKLPKLVFKGMEKGERYNTKIDEMTVTASLYSQLAVGYSRMINDKWMVGATLKYLYGHANVSSDFRDLDLSLLGDKWSVTGDGSVHISFPGLRFVPDENNQIDDINTDDLEVSMLAKPQGHGAAIDLGITYQIFPRLQLSASVLDLGFICWKKNLNQLNKTNDFVYDGVAYDIDSDSTGYWDSYEEQLENMYEIGDSPKAYNTALCAKILLGGEYSFWQDRLGLGVLSKTYIYRRSAWEEFLLSANFRPCHQFSLGLTYSLFDGQWNNLGCSMNFNLGAFNLNFAVDNVPIKWSKNGDIPFPSNQNNIRATMGVGFMFRYRNRDKDKDGVSDKYELRRDTLAGTEFDTEGCSKDSDGDGVPDCIDKCPDTPMEARGLVDSDGCPLDSDGDGVPDYLDQCPLTPKEAYGFVDSVGCVMDSDNDNVPDYLDKCPDTPAEALGTVDSTGCPRDTDGDGVPNYLDKCPDTPKEAWGTVDATGCPMDSDGDGVPDYLDKCPDVPGEKSNNGCPKVKAEVKKIFKKALTGIQFETGMAVIKNSSNSILNEIAKVMKENPSYKLNISGHTDSTGNPEKNLKLSKDRAMAVEKYLQSCGVEASRIHSEGYGDTKPVASNKTTQGRAKNRRVEFEVEF